MPPQEESHRLQKAVLWAKAGTDDYGQHTVGDPVEIDVRWNARRRETADPKGNPLVLDADAVVDRVIAVGSRMWLGELADWLGTGSGADDEEIMEVMTYSETPDVKNRFSTRTVGLAHFRGSMSDA